MNDRQKRAVVCTGVAVAGAALLTHAAKELVQFGKEQAIIAGIPLAGMVVPLLVLLVGYMITQVKRA